MKHLGFVISLASMLALSACGTASNPWGKDRNTELCKFYNSCDSSCGFYGNCGGGSASEKSEPVKSCDLYGNCEE